MIPLKDSIPTHIFPFWTYLIIFINIFVFYLQNTTPNLDSFITQYALIPMNINFATFSTLYPFITNQFLHGGLLHIISNMWFLFIFGDNVEEKSGFIYFPLLYIFSGVIGGLAQYSTMPYSATPILGASGAIAGILGAYFAWFPNHSIKSFVFLLGFVTILNVPAYIMLFYWIATQVIAGVGSMNTNQDIGGIAYLAHIGGFATGWIIAKNITKNETTRL